jgi:hypothetical protein
MNDRIKRHKRYPRFLFFIIAAVAIASLIVMLLWNWLVPSLFHGPVISYLQAAGLLVLTKIIFSSPGRSHSSFPHDRREHFRKIFEQKAESHNAE